MEVESLVVDVRDVRTIVLSGVPGSVEVEEGAGEVVRVAGEACAPGVRFTVLRDGDRATLTVIGTPEGVELEISIPRGARTFSVREQVGPLAVDHRDLSIAVDGLTGPLSLERVASADVRSVVGPVFAEDVRGALTVQDITGPVAAERVGGDLTARRVNGPVAVEDVGGKLVTASIHGPVAYERVAGGLSTSQ